MVYMGYLTQNIRATCVCLRTRWTVSLLIAEHMSTVVLGAASIILYIVWCGIYSMDSMDLACRGIMSVRSLNLGH